MADFFVMFPVLSCRSCFCYPPHFLSFPRRRESIKYWIPPSAGMTCGKVLLKKAPKFGMVERYKNRLLYSGSIQGWGSCGPGSIPGSLTKSM